MKRAKARGVPGKRGRSRRAMFRLLSSVFAIGFCAMSTAAVAAEVVDMRLGRHAGFTRVVFELDAPAGYSLEQNVLEDGSTELVVTLDAGAVDQEKSLDKSLVKGVRLTGKGSQSVARIRLGDGKLRVKEMILGSPPRIVLDVLAPARAAKTAKADTPTTTPTGKAAPAAAPPKIASVSRTTRQVEANPPVASLNHGAVPGRVAKPSAVAPAARPAAKPTAVAPAKPTAMVAKKPPVVVPKAPARTVAVAPKTSVTVPAKTPPPPARQKPAKNTRSMPTAPAAIPQSKSLLTATNIGGGLALLGLVGGGTFFMMRRRGGAELLDEDDLEQDPFSTDNPFAEINDASELVDAPSQAEETAEIPIATVVDEFDSDTAAEDADIPVAKVSADSGPGEGLFDTSVTESLVAEDTDTQVNMPDAPSAEGSGDNMEAYGDSTEDTVVNTMPPISGAGDSSDTMRMLREFEQRMAAMEARLDEVSEAKERLERQVAAQTEELRVQRAAIARTQRALRNLSRPDDESPTEPALRDSNS